MGSGQSSPRNSATQIQVQNADYAPKEQFADKGKPLFKKTNQTLPNNDVLENTQGRNGSDFKCKVEKDLEQVSISENEIHGLWYGNESELIGQSTMISFREWRQSCHHSNYWDSETLNIWHVKLGKYILLICWACFKIFLDNIINIIISFYFRIKLFCKNVCFISQINMMYKPNHTGETVHIACGSQIRYYFRIMLSEVRQTFFEIKKRNHTFHIKITFKIISLSPNFSVLRRFSVSKFRVFSSPWPPWIRCSCCVWRDYLSLGSGFALENSAFCKDLFTLFAFFSIINSTHKYDVFRTKCLYLFQWQLECLIIWRLTALYWSK